MPKLITIFWRDIPAQLIGRAGRAKYRRELAPRFQQAIDRAAMRAGRGSSAAYLEDWRRETVTVEGDIEAAIRRCAERLEEAFPEERLRGMVRNGGRSGGEEAGG